MYFNFLLCALLLGDLKKKRALFVAKRTWKKCHSSVVESNVGLACRRSLEQSPASPVKVEDDVKDGSLKRLSLSVHL